MNYSLLKQSILATTIAAVLSGCLSSNSSDSEQAAVSPGAEAPDGLELPVLAPAIMLTYSAYPDLGVDGSVSVEERYGGSDTSGAVALDSDYMIVADDEENLLRVYRRSGSADTSIAAVKEWDFSEVTGLSKELDVEALTRFDSDKILVVGSHSNKKDGGEAVTDRGHIVALQVSGTGADTEFTHLGTYSFLEQDLVYWDQQNGDRFGFAKSAAGGLAPENVAGFSIEGAVTSHDGSVLWLGFRAPQVDQKLRNKALLVPVLNYRNLVEGSLGEGSAEFGEPLELNLGGRGIRDISKWSGGQYLIVAGPATSSEPQVTENFALYQWNGVRSDAPVKLHNNLEELRVGNLGSIETIVEPHPEQPETRVQLLLDNGDTVWDGQTKVSKDLEPEEQQFLGAFLELGVAQSDGTAPTMVKLTPENGLVGVNTDTRIELSFDEGITLSDDGALILYRDGYPVQTYFKYSNEVSVSFNTVVIRPSTPLDYESSYSIRLQGDFVQDNAGNAFRSDDTLSAFYSAGEPTDLNVGDIYFLAANAEAPDAIAFILTKDIAGGTAIHFSDRDYTAEEGKGFWKADKDDPTLGAPATNEGVFRWTADRDMKAGHIVTIQTDTALSPIADYGQVLGSPSGLGKEETIYAMIGTQVELYDGSAGIIEYGKEGKFIAAITLGGNSDVDIPNAIASGASYLMFAPEGKADQTNAIYDLGGCGTSNLEATLLDQNCWTVTFKSDGAPGFPLFENGSLFEQPVSR